MRHFKKHKKVIGSLGKDTYPNSPGYAIRDVAGSSTGRALGQSLNFAYLIRAHPRYPCNLCSKSFATVYINQIRWYGSRIRNILFCEHGYLGL